MISIQPTCNPTLTFFNNVSLMKVKAYNLIILGHEDFKGKFLTDIHDSKSQIRAESRYGVCRLAACTVFPEVIN